MALAALLVANVALIARPVYRVANRIPVQRVVADIGERVATAGTADVLVLHNTLNARVIERALRNDPDAPVRFLEPDFTAADLPPDRFLLVALIADVAVGVDSRRIERDWGRPMDTIGEYVRLDALPYNELWKRRILARGGEQEHLVSVYEVAASP